jgi:MFS family permease
MSDSTSAKHVGSAATAAHRPPDNEVTRLRDLSPQQWKSGIAAWLGWLFDGLDMHLYTVVATPFVAQLLIAQSLAANERDASVGYYSSVIQASFLVGWALGGGFFGRIGDCMGRARALMLTVLTYAVFTGLSFFAQNWWQLLICRFLAALGIGGEWAVGASLLSETWPRRWRPWIAATLQTAVNVGVLMAMGAYFLLTQGYRFFDSLGYTDPYYKYRIVFVVGVLPALLVLWIRRAVPEPEEWQTAKRMAKQADPRIRDLFRGHVRRTTLLTIGVCATSLTAHWAFMFWFLQHLNNLLKDAGLADAAIEQNKALAMALVMVSSIIGNYLAGGIARLIGYRWTIALMCVAYGVVMFWTYHVARDYEDLFWWLGAVGVCQGLFGLFTMYMPPLFPTLLRTTGAGFCYNIGRLAAAAGTVLFGMFSLSGDHRLNLLYASFLFLPAATIALWLSEPPDE